MPPLVSPPPAAGAGCPRCGQALIDPSGLGWCKACGYCRSLGEEHKPTPTPAKPAAATPAKAPVAAPSRAPLWAILTLAGVVILAAGTFAVNRYVPLKPLLRAQWTTFQILAGLAIMFVGQFLGLMRLAPEEPTLTFKDAIIPFHLLGTAIKHPQRARWAMFIISCGLTMILAALIFIGGLGHWFTYVQGRR